MTNAENAQLAAVSTMLDELNELEGLIEESVEKDEVIEEDSVNENNGEVETISSEDTDALDALSVLDNLDLSAAPEDALKDLEFEISKTEAYDEVEADGGIEETTESTSAVSSAPKTKKTKNPDAKKTVIERDLLKIDPAMFVRDTDQTATEEVRTHMLAKRPTQKKIAEKFDNLFYSMNAGRLPSVYVNICFKAIDAKKEVSQADLAAAVKGTSKKSGDNYSNGTIASQVGQIMNLFDAVGIANRNGSKLTLNPKSAVAERLRNLMVA